MKAQSLANRPFLCETLLVIMVMWLVQDSLSSTNTPKMYGGVYTTCANDVTRVIRTIMGVTQRDV